MKSPEVSVVMSVYNGADFLETTLASVLNQENCNFEFIIIDDGSTDMSARILDAWAEKDKRLRVVHQENAGLTRALMRGCNEARGTLIARQDAGDISLPGRLAQQCGFLRNHQEVGMVTCSVTFIGPENEKLYDSVSIGDELEKGLSFLDVRRIKGPPHHGGTMFRRDAYVKAGGYRAAFVVAQDIDLWLRLAEVGRCVGLEERLYQARLDAGSISGRCRGEQFRLGELAIECAKRRRSGGDDREIIDAHIPLQLNSKGRASNIEKARFYYFLASCLRKSDPISAKRYYRQAVNEHPFFFKAIFRAILG
jgi:glycosyltransferase involved in cell wall biosynthesis